MLDYNEAELSSALAWCEKEVQTTLDKQVCICESLIYLYPPLANSTGHLFVRTEAQWACLFEGKKRALVSGNLRERLWLSDNSLNEFVTKAGELLDELTLPVPSFEGKKPKIDLCPPPSIKRLSRLLGIFSDENSRIHEEVRLEDDLVICVKNTLSSLGLHGVCGIKSLPRYMPFVVASRIAKRYRQSSGALGLNFGGLLPPTDGPKGVWWKF